MRQSLWALAIVGLGFGTLSMVGGTAIGGELGPLAIGYGLLIAVAGLHLVAGLAIRERLWRRLNRPQARMPRVDRLGGQRVF
jgi:predicted membrane protein